MGKTISFIGVGNMGSALVRCASAEQIFITDRDIKKAKALAARLGGRCHVVADNAEAVGLGDYVFLCVKPQVMGEVIEDIVPALNAAMAEGNVKVLVSIAAGVTIESVRLHLSGPCGQLPIVRVMPNTPASIGKGMIGITSADGTPKGIVDDVAEILSGAGRIGRIPESLMDAFSAVASCSPAFVYMFIDALADGAVTAGIARRNAIDWAAQAVMGSAAMVLEDGRHPMELKDAVCSPAGSTIAGVATLEKNGFRYAVSEAVVDAWRRNAELGKD